MAVKAQQIVRAAREPRVEQAPAGPTVAEGLADDEVSEAVHKLLTCCTPTLPITIDDCVAVYGLVHPTLPPAYRLDVTFDATAITVGIRRDGVQVLTRALPGV